MEIIGLVAICSVTFWLVYAAVKHTLNEDKKWRARKASRQQKVKK